MAKVRKLEDVPLTKEQLKFCDAYFHLRDLKKAAISIGKHPDDGRLFWKDRRIRAEIKHREDLAAIENAKIRIKADQLTVQVLDKELHDTITIDMKEVRKAPALGAVKVKAIELGYKRRGLLIDDNFIPDNAASEQQTPRIYRALETSILTHTIETTQQVVQREVIAAPVPRKPLPPLLEAAKIAGPSDPSDLNPYSW